jgi:hypothetical protein
VTEHEDWLPIFGSSEIDLQIVAVLFGTMDMRTPAEFGELVGEMSAHAIGSGLVIAGGFDFYEFADGLEKAVKARFEVMETIEGAL